MYLLTTFANRYSKELYKAKTGRTAKQYYKDRLNTLSMTNKNTSLDKNKQYLRDQITDINKDIKVNRNLRTDSAAIGNSIVTETTPRQNRINQLKDNIAARQKGSIVHVKSNAINSKTTTKLLTGKKLAVGVIATGLGLAAINKLRKSRNDKNKKRGKYRKFK